MQFSNFVSLGGYSSKGKKKKGGEKDSKDGKKSQAAGKANDLKQNRNKSKQIGELTEKI